MNQHNIRLEEDPSRGAPVMLNDAGAAGSENYLALDREFLRRNRPAGTAADAETETAAGQ